MIFKRKLVIENQDKAADVISEIGLSRSAFTQFCNGYGRNELEHIVSEGIERSVFSMARFGHGEDLLLRPRLNRNASQNLTNTELSVAL